MTVLKRYIPADMHISKDSNIVEVQYMILFVIAILRNFLRNFNPCNIGFKLGVFTSFVPFINFDPQNRYAAYGNA